MSHRINKMGYLPLKEYRKIKGKEIKKGHMAMEMAVGNKKHTHKKRIFFTC